jgi:citrate synthase
MVWIPTAEAVRLLGVKRATLYTYASRGWVRTRRLDGRRKLYHRADVERLRRQADGHRSAAARAARALDWGEPVLTTAISGIDRDGPYYRGTPAVDLLDHSLIDVAALLWDVSPEPWPDPVPGAPTRDLQALRRRVDRLPRLDDPLESARLLVASVHAWTALPRTPLVEAARIVSAEHGLNASTFTARIAASTGADLVTCIVAAMATFAGPRHGAQSLLLAERLAQPTWTDPEPGVGHPLYPDGDPRAEALLDRVDHGRMGRLAAHLERVRAAGHQPNLDAGLLAVARSEGLGDDAAPTLFLTGRLLGWIAHVLEQRSASGILRPRGRYGPWGP